MVPPRGTTITKSTNTDIPNTDSSKNIHPCNPPQRIRILGGGLAGMSVAYHLLLLSTSSQENVVYNITIYDTKHEIGTGGASAIAGGLLHPLSPRGKLVHWGLEGLAATNAMMDAAIHATTTVGTESLDVGKDVDAAGTIRLRDELYRIAISKEQEKQLQEIASLYPTMAEWKDNIHPDPDRNDDTSALTEVAGCRLKSGLRLHNGCCVLHVPSYLRGVYKACQIMAQNTNSSIRWCRIVSEKSPSEGQLVNDTNNVRTEQQDYDATIYCYGSNMFQRSNSNNSLVDFTALSSSSFSSSGQEVSNDRRTAMSLPVQLVRGQSMEVTLVQPLLHATLCGKYISPLPPPRQTHQPHHRALIGATHEFSSSPMSTEQVIADLQTRTKDFAPFLYSDPPSEATLSNHVTSIDRITCGYRVQSTRSDYGRRPIIGKIPSGHSSDWIFTGLSSRGLLYHAWYGQLLAQAILQDDESELLESCPDILWWKS